MKNYYIASCVFSSKFPELSSVIRQYIQTLPGFEIVRCCVPKYKLVEFTEKMPEGNLREQWSSLPDTGAFEAGDCVWSLCHNCSNIIEEMHPDVKVFSLWELIDRDERFRFPDHSGLEVTVQDCWRSRERRSEQDAVRSILDKMNIKWIDVPCNYEKADFCGVSLYRPQPPRNPKLAPKHYAEGVDGLFLPHTAEEQKMLMEEYCRIYKTEMVVCYCHYCLEGLKAGGKKGLHLAELLFG